MKDGAGKLEAAGTDAAATSTPLLRLEEFLPYQLNVVASLVSQALSRIYSARYGIAVPEWRVLVTLGQYGVMTGKAIGVHSHMHKTKVSRAVAGLEARGLVERRANRQDRREGLLSLSPAGRSAYAELTPVALDFVRRLVDTIDPAERATFDKVLERLMQRSAQLAAETDRPRRPAATRRRPQQDTANHEEAP
jgi:DNA-binding MarR family transcriptional regulator